ncbi:hypothetical protein TrRE_jg2535, partial [Triparma retinervis]
MMRAMKMRMKIRMKIRMNMSTTSWNLSNKPVSLSGEETVYLVFKRGKERGAVLTGMATLGEGTGLIDGHTVVERSVTGIEVEGIGFNLAVRYRLGILGQGGYGEVECMGFKGRGEL